MLRIMHTNPRRMFILRTNRRGISRLTLTLLTHINRRFLSVVRRPRKVLPRLINLVRISPTLMQVIIRHIHRLSNGAMTMVHVRPNTQRRNRRGIRGIFTMNSKRGIQHMNTHRNQLTRVVRLLFNSTVTNRMKAIRFNLSLRNTILRLRRRHRSFEINNLNRPRDIRSNMVIRVAGVLRRVRNRALTLRYTFTGLTSRQLLMTFLPGRINNLTRTLHRQQGVITLSTFNNIRLVVRVNY